MGLKNNIKFDSCTFLGMLADDLIFQFGAL